MMEISTFLTVIGVLAGVPALLLALLAMWAYCGFRPKPTKTTLKNGMKITQWQQLETDFLYKEIFEEACYRTGLIKFNKGDTIVDAGANIGMFSMWALSECGGDARILSFEPIPTTYGCLAANAQDTGAGSIKAFNFGLSDSETDVTFDHHPFMSIWSTTDGSMDTARLARLAHDLPFAVAAGLAADKSVLAAVPVSVWRLLVNIFLVRAGEREQVAAKLRRLGDVLDEEGVGDIDLLKVDVEGAELFVLKGIKAEQWPRIKQVTLEVEDFDTVKQVAQLLRAKGFNVAWRATELEQVMDALTRSGREAEGDKVVSQVSHLFATRAALPKWLKVDADGRMLTSEPGSDAAAPASAAPSATPASPGSARRRGRRED